jgi:hypothetical protein
MQMVIDRRDLATVLLPSYRKRIVDENRHVPVAGPTAKQH